MAIRNATWQEKFFNTPEANLSIPKFAEIAHLDFPNLLQKAMKLEVSARRGDWSVPEIPVLDGVIQPASSITTGHVDDAVQKLTGKLGKVSLDSSPDEPDELDEDSYDEPDEPDETPEVSVPFTRKVLPQPSERNTVDPGEIMIGGAPAPAVDQRGRPGPENDPWAPPAKAAVTIVKSGVKIQFGAGGKVKVTDGD
jgi:hypothetical protein